MLWDHERVQEPRLAQVTVAVAENLTAQDVSIVELRELTHLVYVLLGSGVSAETLRYRLTRLDDQQ